MSAGTVVAGASVEAARSASAGSECGERGRSRERGERGASARAGAAGACARVPAGGGGAGRSGAGGEGRRGRGGRRRGEGRRAGLAGGRAGRGARAAAAAPGSPVRAPSCQRADASPPPAPRPRPHAPASRRPSPGTLPRPGRPGPAPHLAATSGAARRPHRPRKLAKLRGSRGRCQSLSPRPFSRLPSVPGCRCRAGNLERGAPRLQAGFSSAPRRTRRSWKVSRRGRPRHNLVPPTPVRLPLRPEGRRRWGAGACPRTRSGRSVCLRGGRGDRSGQPLERLPDSPRTSRLSGPLFLSGFWGSLGGGRRERGSGQRANRARETSRSGARWRRREIGGDRVRESGFIRLSGTRVRGSGSQVFLGCSEDLWAGVASGDGVASRVRPARLDGERPAIGVRGCWG